MNQMLRTVSKANAAATMPIMAPFESDPVLLLSLGGSVGLGGNVGGIVISLVGVYVPGQSVVPVKPFVV